VERGTLRAADRARLVSALRHRLGAHGATISAPFAACTSSKDQQVYRAIPARREKRKLVPALNPALAPAPRRVVAQSP